MARTPVSTTPHTKAWMALTQNTEIISHMLALWSRENAAVKAAERRRAKTREANEAKGRNPVKLVLSLDRTVATIDLQLAQLDTVTLWSVVMLVTCIEAYLQDVLVDAATVDVALMSKAEQVTSYADVVAATSLDELANDMRQRWARGWLSDGGPTRWIASLSRMGAKDYPVGLAPRLELIWGIRHVTVHTAGVATADFLKRHPGAAKAVGDRVQVRVDQFRAFLADAREFLEPTERFFLARCPSLGLTSRSDSST